MTINWYHIYKSGYYSYEDSMDEHIEYIQWVIIASFQVQCCLEFREENFDENIPHMLTLIP